MTIALAFFNPHRKSVLMWKTLKAISEALGAIAARLEEGNGALFELVTQSHTQGNLEARVADLERSLTKQMLEAEALIVRADARFKAARSSEERGRRLAAQYDEDAEYDDEGYDPEQSGTPGGTVGAGGNGQGVFAMPTPEQYSPPISAEDAARSRKWSRG